MRKLLILALLLVSGLSYGQLPGNWQYIGGSKVPPVNSHVRNRFDSDSGTYSMGRLVLIDVFKKTGTDSVFLQLGDSSYAFAFLDDGTGGGGIHVDTIWRKSGTDSVFYMLSDGNVMFAFRDSIGTGGGTGFYVETGETFTGTATSTFTLANTPLSDIHILGVMNNAFVSPSDYSVTGNVITTTFTTEAADQMVWYYGYGVSPPIIQTHETFTGLTGTSVTLADVPVSDYHVLVSLNNAFVSPTDYTQTTTSVNLAFTLESSDELVVYYTHN